MTLSKWLWRSIVPIAALYLISCNGSSDTTGKIDNQTIHQLKIVLYGGGGRLSDTLVFAPGQSRAITQKTYSAAQEEEEDCAARYDSMLAIAADSGRVTKLIQLENNWQVETEQTKQIPKEFEHTCTFIIRDSDIEF